MTEVEAERDALKVLVQELLEEEPYSTAEGLNMWCPLCEAKYFWGRNQTCGDIQLVEHSETCWLTRARKLVSPA